MLTLLGIGGLGKTRLSLQIAGDVLDSYRDGAWFVDLAPIRDPSIIGERSGQGAGRARGARQTASFETLCAHLKSRNLLLILDNCEHLVEASAELVHAILSAAPEVRIIATSREALRVPGEQTYTVLPLPVPKRSDGIEALSRSPAVRLFVERAQLHKPTFALNEQEAPAVAELVARLEGIPLALELAAARVRALTVADINVRLKDRYKLLTGGGRVLLERQQTLRALVDWSYDLLQDHEQVLLARLAVFAGGFELRGGRGGLRRRPAVAGGRARLAHVAGREVVGDDGGARRRHALPIARDDPRLRPRKARCSAMSSRRLPRGTVTTTSRWRRPPIAAS